MPIKPPPGIPQPLLSEAEEIPGVRAYLAEDDRRRLYSGAKARPVPWAVVGAFLMQWWRQSERGRMLTLLGQVEQAEAELSRTRADLARIRAVITAQLGDPPNSPVEEVL
jgi:hypothetical protein